MALLCYKQSHIYTTRITRTIFVADKDNSISAALSNDGDFRVVGLSPIPLVKVNLKIYTYA